MNDVQIAVTLLGFIGGLLTFIAGFIASKLSKLTDSVDLLNVRVAVVIERMDNHDQRIREIETKINRG